MAEVFFKKQKIFETGKGDVLHGLKSSDKSYHGFGEVYFSEILYGSIKGWKKHKSMTMNLLVPLGKVAFVVIKSDQPNHKNLKIEEFILSKENYGRLTVPPNHWVAFKGLEKNLSIIVNVSDIEHSDNEVEKKDIDEIKFNWREVV